MLFSVLFAALWLSSIAMFRTRSIRVIGAGIEEYRRIVSASFWTFGIIAMANLLAKIFLAHGYLVVALPVGTLGLLVSRGLWRYYIAAKRAQGKCQTVVLAIGDRMAIGPVKWSTGASLRRKQLIA
jgi:tellurite resistance protein TehA-like permease